MRYLIALASASVAFAQFTIDTPVNVKACSSQPVTWTGGTAPYTLQVEGAADATALETFIVGPSPYTWNVIESAGTQVFLRITTDIGDVAQSAIFTIQPNAACCTARGTTVVAQKTLPVPGQCLSGDTGTTLTSTSTCASLTVDGSTLYVDSTTTACCDSIPAGTFVCTGPPPPLLCANPVPTNAAATTVCLAGDRSITLAAASTCDFLNNVLGTTTTDLYTVSGSDICCDSIPSGTTICVPTTAPPSCPTTTSPPTTTATQTSTTTTTTTAASGPTNVSGYKDSQYLGCYVDSRWNRVLPDEMSIPSVTVEACIDSCNSAGFAYAGLEYSGECYCGNTVPATIATDGRCDMTCAGNSQEICGGGNGISVYSSGSTASVLPSYGLWTYTGCYEDSVAARTMPVTITTIDSNSMTVEKCLDACQSRGYSYAGLEYAQECYCGSALPPTPATDGQCNMVCKGNNMEYCGGGNGLTVYTYQYSPPQSRRAFY